MLKRAGSNYCILMVVFSLLLILSACNEFEELLPASKRGLITTFENPKSVTYVTFSPDGSTLASGSVDATVKLWDVTTGEEVITFDGHSSVVYSVGFSPDGTLLASVNGWFYAPSPPRLFGGGKPSQTPTPIKETPTPIRNELILWDLISNAEQKRWEFENPVYTVAFSPDGQTIAIGSGDPRELSDENTLRILSVVTESKDVVLQELDEQQMVHSIAFSPDGKTLASGSDNGVTLWNLISGKWRTTLAKEFSDRYRSIVFSPNGDLLASGSLDGFVRLWNVSTCREEAMLGQHGGIVYAVAFNPDGSILASAGQDGKVRLWDVKMAEEVATIRLPRTRVWSVAFSPDGTLLATGSDDGMIRLWSITEILE